MQIRAATSAMCLTDQPRSLLQATRAVLPHLFIPVVKCRSPENHTGKRALGLALSLVQPLLLAFLLAGPEVAECVAW